MIRIRLMAAALAVFFVAPGAAQVMRPLPPISQLPTTVQPSPQLTTLEVDDDAVTRAMTIEEATKLIAKLTKPA